ncbi:MAG TPA: hypothetical protein VFB80_24445 [Pirellulaceae bacterium]|nr:hypothetical protein [Pirellulaceae bacterium]
MKTSSPAVLASLTVFVTMLAFDRPSVAAEVGVRIRFGLTDKEPQEWDGTVSVKPGQVAAISGWRFELTDRANGTEGWTASTRPAAVARTNAQKAKAKAKQAANKAKTPEQKAKAAANQKAKAAAGAALADNGVLLTLANVDETSVVSVKTAQGDFTITLAEIPYGKVVEKLDGAVEVERIAAARQVSTDRKTDDDYPSAAAAPDGTVYVVCASYTPGIDRNERARTWQTAPDDLQFLADAPGGDQLLVRVVKGGASGEPLAVTESGADIYKSAVAVAGDGTAWIFWSQNKNYKPFPNNPTANFDIYARPLKAGKLGETVRISESSESDVWPVAATDPAGNVWIAWQGARQGSFKILARRQTSGGWSPEMTISTHSRNCWAPAIATTKSGGGKVAIAWDTYDKGDYDVFVREFDAAAKGGEARPVVNSADYEARPAIAYDREGALWVAWEQSGPTWGKDWGALVQRKGIGLYKDRQIGLAVLKGGQWMEPPQLVAQALPGVLPRRRINNVRVPAIEPGAESRTAGQEAEAARNNVHNNIARLLCDAGGRIWLLARARQNDFRAQIGSVWMTHATYYDGNAWVGPILVPHTDNLLYNSPAAVPLPGGGLLVAHSSDHRQDRHVNQRGANAQGNLVGEDPFDNDLYLSRLEIGGDAKPATLVVSTTPPDPSAVPSDATVKERAEIERIRGYRAQIGGKNLQIVRGEFHRHTEISGDGGNDGPLEDMWRYAIDVAAMDWLGCGDHDNGGHREYPWWLTQKTTDAFHLPGVFEPPFTYERSVRYPEGHRNVVFTRRGIRTLPRLPITDRDNEIHAPDTQLMYKYLKLFDGVCAVHTSATSMGTDWRDNDPAVEPMVEIYQGARQNYERPGAPRSPTADDAIGGWEPKGFVNLALLKGYKFSFQSSSDHGSTHISYALVYAEKNSRDAILAAMKQRHTYAATDNIIADYRCTSGGKEHLMGDAFTSTVPPTVKVKLAGTAPFAKVTLVKDDVEIPLEAPQQAELELTWTDPKPEPGKESYYYIRGEQSDGELVWVSPMWITYQPAR